MEICFICNELVTSGKFFFKERTYHLKCFKCSKCQISLSQLNPIANEFNLLLCETCSSETVHKCFKCKEFLVKGESFKKIKENIFYHSECFSCDGPCKKPIHDRFFQKNEDDYFCKECFDLISDRCNKCQNNFESGVSRISLKNNIFFHNECFLCKNCSQIINSAYFLTKSGDYLCKTCNDLTAKRCNNCHQIFEPGVTYKKIGENLFFHTYCFTCSGPCKKPIITTFYEEKPGVFICKECSEINADRCSKCKQIFNTGISYKKLDDNVFFHKECFTCAGPCGRPINSLYFKNDCNEYHCKECNDIEADRCLKCDQVFEPGSSYIVIKDGVFFHNECFLCSGSCNKQLSTCFIESSDGYFYCTECGKKNEIKRAVLDQNLDFYKNNIGKKGFNF